MSKRTARTHVDLLTPIDDDRIEPTTTLPLREALFVYGGRPGDGYVLHHDVKPDGTLSPGKPLDCATLAHALLDVAAKRDVERLTYLPDHVLATGRETTVWWRKAQSTPLWFKTNDPRLTALNGKSIPCPALVFRASQRTGLDVWALAGNERPYAETPLLRAPFMNIMHDDHGVCLGTARDGALLDATTKAMTTAAWETLFFESNFTHSPPSLNYEKDETYVSLLEFLTRFNPGQQPWQFPISKLKPAKLTLADVLNA